MAQSLNLKQVADKIGAVCESEPNLVVEGISSLDRATSSDISFLSSKKFVKFLSSTKALAVILTAEDSKLFEGNKLISDDPYLAYAKLTTYFSKSDKHLSGIDSTAVISKDTAIGKNVYIGPRVVIKKGVSIGDGVCVGAGTYVGKSCTIGSSTKIRPNATILDDSVIGSGCILHTGCVIGDDGFGFAKDGDKWFKITQLGKVIIGDRVEIGSNTTIDCGAIGDTVIKDGVKIDNLVHIAHNVHIGDNTAIAGAAAIAGSVIVGKNCTIAGMVGLVDHIEICDNVHITGKTMVSKSITKPGVYSSGWAAKDNHQWKKMVARISRLDKLNQRVAELERKLKVGSDK